MPISMAKKGNLGKSLMQGRRFEVHVGQAAREPHADGNVLNARPARQERNQSKGRIFSERAKVSRGAEAARTAVGKSSSHERENMAALWHNLRQETGSSRVKMPFCMLQPSAWIDSPLTVTNTRLDAFCVLFMRALPGLTHVATDSGSPCRLIQQMLRHGRMRGSNYRGRNPHSAQPCMLLPPFCQVPGLSKRQLSTGTISSPELMQACRFPC